MEEKVRQKEEEEEEEEEDEEEVEEEVHEIPVDEDGRIFFGGELNFNTRSFHQLLSIHQIQTLYADCSKVCRVKAVEEEEEGGEYSRGDTYWIQADAEPRCALEAIALNIFTEHCQKAKFNPACSGAEFWTQVIGREDDIGWHFDKDYSLELSGVNIYPHLATVTYLTQGGGPTSIIHKPGSSHCGQGIEGEATKLWISFPQRAKHISFDGRNLHGAPADLSEIALNKRKGKSKRKRSEEVDKAAADGTSERVTFLVNVWLNHRPGSAEVLDEKTLSQLECRTCEKLNFGKEMQPKTVALAAEADRKLSWEFSEVSAVTDEGELENDAYELSMMLPGSEVFEEDMLDVLEVCCEANPITITAVLEDDDDEEEQEEKN